MKTPSKFIAYRSALLALLLSSPTLPAAPALQVTAPVDHQVYQRDTRTVGRILVAGTLKETDPSEATLEARLLDGDSPGAWKQLGPFAAGSGEFSTSFTAPAGGWYRLEVRALNGGTTIAEAAVDHVGIGEVFVVAGQSNSANHGAGKQQPKSGLVSSCNTGTWQPANDPQPGASGNGGSFLPSFGDAIAAQFQVPVGLVATGVGASSVREWLPRGIPFPNPPTLTRNVTQRPDGTWESKGELFRRLITRMKQAGPNGFRAVLWHQGESDANQKDTSRTLPGKLYEEMLGQVIRDSHRATGRRTPWFVAQASYHTPDDPGSPDIRASQAALWKSGLALEGPDTDALTGPFRDNNGRGVHFSAAGLQAHGAAWAEKITPWLIGQLDSPRPLRVFILAGQSNMEGQGVVDMDHADHYNGGKGNLLWSMVNSASKDRMKHLKDADGNWTARDDVTISFTSKDKERQGPLTIGYTGYGGSTHIGPELQFGHVVGDHFDEPVLLVKTAWGGKSLHKDFRPPSAGGKTGIYYTQMITEIRKALATLGDREFKICGFVWMQGWNDMVSKEATAEYAENLIHLATDIRSEFKAPKLPIVIGELGNGGPAKEGSGMATFRAAQKAGTSKIPKTRFVPTSQFARPAELSPNVGHGHHWFGNAECYFLVGDALGHAALKLLAE